MPSKFEENLEKTSFQEPWQYAVETARMKAVEVAERLKVCGISNISASICIEWTSVHEYRTGKIGRPC